MDAHRIDGLAAVIPAAGASRRMGRCKALLDLRGSPLLARCAGLLRAGGVSEIVVVTPSGNAELSKSTDDGPARQLDGPVHDLARKLGLRTVAAPADGDMFASIRAGLSALGPGSRAVFILPVDMPLVRPLTIMALAAALQPETPAVVPVHAGQRGHPPLLSARAVGQVLAWEGGGGLRAALSGLPGLATLEVDDPGVLLDLDTPEDLALALRSESHAPQLTIAAMRSQE